MRIDSTRAARALLALGSIAVSSHRAAADEFGVSYWLPGTYGSLSAVPAVPGVQFATFNWYNSVSAGRNAEFQLGGGGGSGGAIVAGVSARVDLQAVNLAYVFANPVLGGQFALGMTALGGVNTTSIYGTLNGPNGGTLSGGKSETLVAIGDLYPTATLKWNQGVNNFMVYATGDIPVGSYDSARLANIGIGHGAIDAGVGYTYFNPQTGHELSAVVGATYNFINPSTDYQNGIDAHLDWGASQFLSKTLFIGAVGYVYDQITGDSGSGARLGSFESRVVGVGPQIGFLFPVGGLQGYVNLKGYGEFDAVHRPSGYNLWLTLAITPAAPEAAAAAAPLPTRKN